MFFPCDSPVLGLYVPTNPYTYTNLSGTKGVHLMFHVIFHLILHCFFGCVYRPYIIPIKPLVRKKSLGSGLGFSVKGLGFRTYSWGRNEQKDAKTQEDWKPSQFLYKALWHRTPICMLQDLRGSGKGRVFTTEASGCLV